MREIKKIFMLFLSVAFFVAPLFAEETPKISNEDIELVGEIGEGVIVGKVVSLDVGKALIVVKASDRAESEFSIISDETILWKGIDDIELGDINSGQEVEVGYYTDDEGKLIASWVDVIVAEEILQEAKDIMEEIKTDEQKGSPKGSSQ